MLDALQTGSGLLAMLLLAILGLSFALSLKLRGLKVALISTLVALIVAAFMYFAVIFVITNSM